MTFSVLNDCKNDDFVTNLLADTGETASFATLVNRINNPVDPCVSTNLQDKVKYNPTKIPIPTAL